MEEERRLDTMEAVASFEDVAHVLLVCAEFLGYLKIAPRLPGAPRLFEDRVAIAGSSPAI